MKKRLNVVITVMVVTITGLCAARAELIPYDPNTMSFPVSVQQAEESARTWAGNQGLVFTMNDVSVSAMHPSEPALYVLKTTDGSQEFQVNCLSGEMVLWTDNTANQAYCAKTPPTYDESNQIPLATLHSLVTGFLAAKYANFSTMNMESADPDEPACYYYQTLSNGAHYVSNFAVCQIDEWSGQIVRYCGEHRSPVTISTEPDISSTQAEQIALDYGGTVRLENGSYPQSAFVLENSGLRVHADDLDVQRLYWEMRIVIHEQASYTAENYSDELQNRPAGPTGQVMGMLIDAYTGVVFFCEPDGPLGGGGKKLDSATIAKMKSRKPNPERLKSQLKFKGGKLEIDGLSCSSLAFPPLGVGRMGYLYVKYLPMLYGGTMKVSSGNIQLKIADKTTVLHAGSNALKIDSKMLRLAHPPMVIAGRTYVSFDAIKLICGADASWDTQKKILKVKSGSIPLGARFRYMDMAKGH